MQLESMSWEHYASYGADVRVFDHAELIDIERECVIKQKLALTVKHMVLGVSKLSAVVRRGSGLEVIFICLCSWEQRLDISTGKVSSSFSFPRANFDARLYDQRPPRFNTLQLLTLSERTGGYGQQRGA